MKAAHCNSRNNQLGNLRPIIIALMKDQGRNFGVCELCSIGIPFNEYEIHHTKYEGATYYDLLIVCRSCNKLSENVGLV